MGSGRVDQSYEIYLSLYQAIMGDEEHEPIYDKFPRDFFDLIVIDECHRGSAREDVASLGDRASGRLGVYGEFGARPGWWVGVVDLFPSGIENQGGRLAVGDPGSPGVARDSSGHPRIVCTGPDRAHSPFSSPRFRQHRVEWNPDPAPAARPA